MTERPTIRQALTRVLGRVIGYRQEGQEIRLQWPDSTGALPPGMTYCMVTAARLIGDEEDDHAMVELKLQHKDGFVILAFPLSGIMVPEGRST